jgi:S-adenosyl methyltransferase
MYDYVLGGKYNLPVDREAVKRIRAQTPDLEDAAWVNRGFHRRVARWMAADQGIRQFIDIGSGLPTGCSTHGVVQSVAPEARVAYVDNDPMVSVYAGELLGADGTTRVITADLREPDVVLSELRTMIDFDEPAGLLMTAVLHFVADASDPWGLVARYVGALAPGSYLALSHATYDRLPTRLVQATTEVYSEATQNMYPRTQAEVERFFEGLQLVPPYQGAEPKVIHVGLWGAEDPELADSDGSHWWYGGVACRPGPDADPG